MKEFLSFDDDQDLPSSPAPTPRSRFISVEKLRDNPDLQPEPAAPQTPDITAISLNSAEEAVIAELSTDTPDEEKPVATPKKRWGRSPSILLIGAGIAALLGGTLIVLSPPNPAPAPVGIDMGNEVVTPTPTPEPTLPEPPTPEPVVPPTVPEVEVEVEAEDLINEPSPELNTVYDNVERVIGFNPDQATLTKKGRTELNKIAASVPQGTTVDIYGYVYKGTQGSTFTLDKARADTVAKYLKKRGVVIGKVEGKGKLQRGVVVAWMQNVDAS